MSKLAFCLTTLIAAIPAALLAFFLITTFLFHFDQLPPALMAVLGLTLLAAVAVLLSPAMVYLAGRSRAAKTLRPAAVPAAAGGAVAAAALSDEQIVAEEFGADDMVVEEFGADGMAAEEFGDSDAAEPASDDLFEVSGDDAFESFDDFDEPKRK